MPTPQDLAIWDRLAESYGAYNLALGAFLRDGVDRVALLRVAMQGRHDMAGAYMLRYLKPGELQQLFPELVYHASYANSVIQLMRDAILALPRSWVITHIEEVAAPLLENATDDEYARLLELYHSLDTTLTLRLAERAASSFDPDIREAGEYYLDIIKAGGAS